MLYADIFYITLIKILHFSNYIYIKNENSRFGVEENVQLAVSKLDWEQSVISSYKIASFFFKIVKNDNYIK